MTEKEIETFIQEKRDSEGDAEGWLTGEGKYLQEYLGSGYARFLQDKISED